jgi:hypothetical protein
VAAAFAMASVAAIAHAAPSDLFSQHDDFTPQPNQIGPHFLTTAVEQQDRPLGVNLEMAQPRRCRRLARRPDRPELWRRSGLTPASASRLATGTRTTQLTTDGPGSAGASGTTFVLAPA